jgi:DNA polymerase
VVVAVDSSNIELRVNHCLADQVDTVQMFREGRDLYCEFASVLFNRPITKADKHERQLGKLAHLSLGYGCGADKFQEICRLNGVILTPGEAKRIVTLWRDTYPRIPALWRACGAALPSIVSGAEMWIDSQQLCRTAYGRINTKPHNQILYPELTQDGDKWTYKVRNETKFIYSAKVTENLCQHLARNIIADQLLAISAKYPVVLTVHDEVVYLAPEAEAQEALEFGVAAMSKSPTWWPAIPLAAEGEFGRTYS